MVFPVATSNGNAVERVLCTARRRRVEALSLYLGDAGFAAHQLLVSSGEPAGSVAIVTGWA